MEVGHCDLNRTVRLWHPGSVDIVKRFFPLTLFILFFLSFLCLPSVLKNSEYFVILLFFYRLNFISFLIKVALKIDEERWFKKELACFTYLKTNSSC